MAVISSATYSPTSPKVSHPITVTVTTSAGDNPTFNWWYFGPNGTVTGNCQASGSGTSWTGTCVFTPPVAGSYVLDVGAKAAHSPFSDDDFREFNLTVTP
jgi:PKD repeat protein